MNMPANINLQHIEQLLYTWVFTDGLRVVLVFSIMMVLLKLVDLFTKKLVKLHIKTNEDVEYYKKVHTIHAITKSLLDVIILLVGSMIILQQIGINIGPILAAAGVVGIAVGFGSQKFVEDLIGSAMILVHNQVRVGDVVQIGDKSGLVEKITLGMLVLRDIRGDVHFIRTGKLDVITNMTRDFSYYVVNVGVSYDEDVEKIIDILKNLGEGMQKDPAFSKDILEPIEIFGLDKFEESSIVIQARLKTKPIEQWRIGREFNLRMKKKFDELGIQMPYPQSEVRIIKQD